MFPEAWTRSWAPWVALVVAVASLVAMQTFVDLSPQVESDFFFSEDDPQLVASRQISEKFGSGNQIVVRVQDRVGDADEYRDRIAELTEAFTRVEGIESAYSIATDDPERSPLFERVLLTPEASATNVVLQSGDIPPDELLPDLEAVVEEHRSDSLAIVMSGVPVIVEQIRRALFRDLVVFSVAAILVFAVLMSAVYRDAAVVVGTMVTCAVSISTTLLLTRAVGVAIGLLTANLITIVFVLTLSHVVFLSANWIRASGDEIGRPAILRSALRDTFEGSFWSMTTTLLGFLSLLVASAKPLRELGVAGAIGTVTAMVVAYAVYPAFLGRWARPRPPAAAASMGPGVPAAGRGGLVLVGALVLTLGAGALRLDTDPGLLTYFAEGSDLREGLETIDRDGGSSTLDLVVRDPDGGRMDSPQVFEKMQAVQEALEADPAVGMVLSPSILLEHARTMPLARFLSLEVLLDLASSPQLGGVGRSYVTEDRLEGHLLLRMHETVAMESRQEVMDGLVAETRAAGLEPVLVGGLYDLQAQLGRLISASLKIGIGGLLALFLLVAAAVSRSLGTTARMWLCLAGIPLVILGTFGHLGIAVDIITSPAANVALAMGVDSMIHLVVRVRRLGARNVSSPWGAALSQIRQPVLAATGIICAGFGIFVLSSFPPTQRFGLAVILGTVAAATMALYVLPGLATPTRAVEA